MLSSCGVLYVMETSKSVWSCKQGKRGRHVLGCDAWAGMLNTNSGARPCCKGRADVDGHRPAIREGGSFGLQHLATGTRQAQRFGMRQALKALGIRHRLGVSVVDS